MRFASGQQISFRLVSVRSIKCQVCRAVADLAALIMMGAIVSGCGGGGTVAIAPQSIQADPSPSIVIQPVSQAVTAGQTVTFSVVATGTAPLSYQWQRNSVNIVGATGSSYTTPATTAADNGTTFDVIIGNAGGTLTSNVAMLTVNAAAPGALTPDTSNLNFNNANTGSNSVLSVIFTNSGSSDITISNVAISGPGFTVGGISTGQIVPSGQTATLNVTFAPTSTGSVTGTATVSSDASNSPVAIGLSGAGVSSGSYYVSLNWIASPSSISGYNVYRATVSGGPYTQLNSSLVTTIQYQDSNVQLGQTYYYVVDAVDSSGDESPYSNQTTVSVPTS
jgi:hypothetical protein